MPVLRYTFTVIGGRNSRIESREVEQLAPTPIAPTVMPDPKVPTAEDGIVTIFNGKDLTGRGAGTRPEALKVDPDGNLTAKGDAKVRELIWLLTEKEYNDYILRLEFQFVEPLPGDTHSGVAIRSGPNHIGARGMQLEVQLRDTAKGALSTGAVIFGEGNAKKPLASTHSRPTWHTVASKSAGRR